MMQQFMINLILLKNKERERERLERETKGNT
jgi:hypothetical protein